MPKRNDIIIEQDSMDLQILDGDFVVTRSDFQNIKLILLYSPGSLKQYPDVGVYIQGDRHGPLNKVFETRLKGGIIDDGYDSSNIVIGREGKIKISIDE